MRPCSPIEISEGSGGQISLSQSSRAWTVAWMGLRALGWTSSKATSPCSLPVRLSFKSGKNSFFSGLISNPRFHEMMMGWPIGWTAPVAPVTEFQAWLRRSRGQFSRLLSTFDQPPPRSTDS